MARRDWIIGIAGAALLAVGLFVLDFSVLLPQYDEWGWQVDCGTGYAADLAQARTADAAGSDFVSSCESALLIRRLWTIPLVIVGTAALIVVLLRGVFEQERLASPGGRNR